jgi:hypothetical protein
MIAKTLDTNKCSNGKKLTSLNSLSYITLYLKTAKGTTTYVKSKLQTFLMKNLDTTNFVNDKLDTTKFANGKKRTLQNLLMEKSGHYKHC